MFERFTERARDVIKAAQAEAREMRHPVIGSDHILLGILRDPECAGAEALSGLGVTAEAVREKIVREAGEQPMGQSPFTPRAKKVLELALREALSLGHNYIGTEHLLMAVVRDEDSEGAAILLALGISADDVRDEVRYMLQHPTPMVQKLPSLVAPYIRVLRQIEPYLTLSSETMPMTYPEGESLIQRYRRMAAEIEARDAAILALRELVAKYEGLE